MRAATVSALLRQGRIERVEPDLEAAHSKLREAHRHLVSAGALAATDPEGAYVLLYDAARKALDAHMLARGYRVSKSRLGAHEATAAYGIATLASGKHAQDVTHFDRMRKNRNKSEYGIWVVGASTIETDVKHASGIVEAVEEDLRGT
ncbi:MAG: hypothetical protein WDA71_10745 [Actinomycetota bacterium]